MFVIVIKLLQLYALLLVGLMTSLKEKLQTSMNSLVTVMLGLTHIHSHTDGDRSWPTTSKLRTSGAIYSIFYIHTYVTIITLIVSSYYCVILQFRLMPSKT